jgi:nitrogen-specific signal transduction histidine kinase
MKNKLKTVFVLITLSLLGIVIFQIYWTINAYHVNKKKFDTDIDIAMQKAMDDCKKDYFDSIRVVLVRRLSDTGFKIAIDTIHEADTINVQLRIRLSDRYTGNINPPFQITIPKLNVYRSKINHPATLPELLTETSFYVPGLMEQIKMVLGMNDIHSYPNQFKAFKAFNDTHVVVPEDTMMKINHGMDNSIYGFPKNYKQADSLKLRNYLSIELEKIHINTPFTLNFSQKTTESAKLNSHYSETAEYSYKYHGFKLFNIIGPEFFARAIFRNPKYGIIHGMTITLLMSALLIVFTVFCFWYVLKTIIDQKKLAELKDDFINNMTHELKTPIATMTVAIEGLQKFNAVNDAEKTQRYLQTSKNELLRLNEIVSKVLNVAAFGNREIKLVKEKINIDELVKDVIETEQLKADKKVNITYESKDNIGTIIADKLHFRNMLANLVDNSVKYSGDPVLIRISVYKNGGNVVFTVKDNGIGIPPAHINQVFDKFHRVPTGNIHNVKGTGLGLTYVKYIVEAHGGNITVKSEINTGSEFIVSIPLMNG